MSIVTRSGKGANLTANEVDNNFLELSASVASVASVGQLIVKDPGGFSASVSQLNFQSPITLSFDGTSASVSVPPPGLLVTYQGNVTGVATRLNFMGEGVSTSVNDINEDFVNILIEGGGGGDFSAVASDILPETNSIYDLGASNKKWFDGYFANSISLGDVTLSNDSGSISVNGDIVTTNGISADIANIGSINIIEDTISVDNLNTPADEYSLVPESILKIDSGLRILGSTYGNKYVLVNGNGTPEENAAELQAAYDYAKELRAANPISVDGSNQLSSADRYSVVISPGEYTFNTYFAIDTDGIDVISLTGGRDVVINIPITNDLNSAFATSVWIQDVDYITVRGINTQTHQFRTEVYGINVLIENCKGGGPSFAFGDRGLDPTTHYGKGPQTSSTFKNCEGGDYSFLPYTRNNYATFIDCKGGMYSFGAFAEAALNHFCTNCTAGAYSFGYSFKGFAAGSYTNCTGREACFVSYPVGDKIVQSIITNCTAGADSFAFSATLTSFGKIINCVGGNNSFFTLSSAGGINNGMVINCILLPPGFMEGTASSFSSTGQGIIRNCINANGTLVNS
jgi:hypothetical protein